MNKILPIALTICVGMTIFSCGNEPEDDISGGDWRTTGVVTDSGSVTHGGENVDLLVCVHENDATLYLDSADQQVYAFLDYPFAISDDPTGRYLGIDFSDRDGDGNGDAAISFTNDVLFVWYWDEDSQSFIYQDDESNSGKIAADDLSVYAGIWLGEADNDYDSISFDESGNWKLTRAGETVDKGYLKYVDEWGGVYAYGSDGSASRTEIQNGKLYITSFGYFNYGEGMVEIWYDAETTK